MIQLLLNKTMPHFQLLPMSKVGQSKLRIHKVPPFTVKKSDSTRIVLLLEPNVSSPSTTSTLSLLANKFNIARLCN